MRFSTASVVAILAFTVSADLADVVSNGANAGQDVASAINSVTSFAADIGGSIATAADGAVSDVTSVVGGAISTGKLTIPSPGLPNLTRS